MAKNSKIFIGTLWLMFIVFQVSLGQESPSGERGEIRDTEFIIRKDRVLSLPKQPRVFEKTPELPPMMANPSYSYEVNDFFIDLKPLQLEPQPFVKNFQVDPDDETLGIAKVGYGNYASPLVQLDIHNSIQDEMTFGIHLNHQGYYQGPVDGSNSASDHTKVDLNGSLYRDFIEFYGKLGYHRDMYHFYGYTPAPFIETNPEDIRQLFNTIHTTLGLRRIDRTEPFDYGASASFRLFNDNYLAKESEGNIKLEAGFRANDFLRGGIETMLHFTSPSDLNYSDINRNYFKLHPHVAYLKDGIHLNIGANVIHENDIVPNKKSDFHIFPTVFLSYHFTPEFGVYGNYAGDVIRNTYYDFVMENPFLGPSSQLRNTIQNHGVDLGISGVVNDEVNYKIGVKYSDFTNMHFYGNNSNDSTKFQLIYDDVTTVLNYHASANYSFEGWYRLDASVNYYQYSLSDLNAAWHRPEWEINLKNQFIPEEKWLIHANINAMGGIEVINLESETRTMLKPLFDLHISVDYAITPRFSVFAIGNNLLNQKYERFWNYRVRGIQGIGGVSFKF